MLPTIKTVVECSTFKDGFTTVDSKAFIFSNVDVFPISDKEFNHYMKEVIKAVSHGVIVDSANTIITVSGYDDNFIPVDLYRITFKAMKDGYIEMELRPAKECYDIEQVIKFSNTQDMFVKVNNVIGSVITEAVS